MGYSLWGRKESDPTEQLSTSIPSFKHLQRAVAARCPQLGGDPVSAGLLGAGLFLCLEGVIIIKVKRQPSEWEKIIANEAVDK